MNWDRAAQQYIDLAEISQQVGRPLYDRSAATILIHLLLLRTSAIFCVLPLCERGAEISAGVMAASVPSAGMVLHQTDLAF
jgi:hypothetical protein